MRKYQKKRLANDILFKLSRNHRRTINKAFKSSGYTKNSSSEKLLGCSYDEYIKYIENKFEEWMTHDNYGLYNGELNYGWDIDHIIPISYAKSEEDIININHYTSTTSLQ